MNIYIYIFYSNNLMHAWDFKVYHHEMNWLSALFYFNDETDFIICSKLYLNICIYKFLGKKVQKKIISFIYIFRLVPRKNIQLPIHVMMNDYAHI